MIRKIIVVLLAGFSALGLSVPVEQPCSISSDGPVPQPTPGPTPPQPSNNSAPTCIEIVLPVFAKAENFVLPTYPNDTDPGTVYKYLGGFNDSTLTRTPVSGIYNISASYCTPTVNVKGREETIQMFLHGLGLDKTYWSGMDFASPQFADEYSWISHARSQGYSTLALDNLGSGNSSRPDPISIVQGPLQVEIMHTIIKSLRSGSLPNISQHYKKIVFVTHSYGSIIGRKVATDYPHDGADAYILTAASNTLVGIQRAIGTFQAQAASVRHPAELGNLPPGYLSFSNQGLRDAVYSFDGDFDPKMLAWDQQYPHSFAAGEIAAPLSSLVANTSIFEGPVMILTGKYDVIVCGTGNFTQSDGDCGNGKDSNPAITKAEFPKATFDYYIPDHTGHNVNTHYSAPESFGAAHMFLERVGF